MSIPTHGGGPDARADLTPHEDCDALLPTLADRDMHHALSLMLVAHEKNIGAVDVRLRGGADGAQPAP